MEMDIADDGDGDGDGAECLEESVSKRDTERLCTNWQCVMNATRNILLFLFITYVWAVPYPSPDSIHIPHIRELVSFWPFTLVPWALSLIVLIIR